MVRAFTEEQIPDDTVRKILAAANRAPSAGFSQGYAFLVLTDKDDRSKFWTSLNQTPDLRDGNPVKRAPMIVVPLASKEAYMDRYALPDKGWSDRADKRWLVPYWYIDTGFTALLLLLSAVDRGLGAKLFGILPPVVDAFRDQFGIPETYTPIGAIAIGYRDHTLDPDPPWRPKIARRTLDSLVHQGKW